jgi:hypothetical protein
VAIASADYDPFFKATSFAMYLIAFYDILRISPMFYDKNSS